MSSGGTAAQVRRGDRKGWWGSKLLVTLLTVAAAGLYAATAAPGTIFGDPSEYQFIPAIWGIAHPPGYAFYTLLAGVWQRAVAIGSVAYRSNLLAACAGAWAVSRVLLIALRLMGQESESGPYGQRQTGWVMLSVAVGGMAVATAPDLWQHSIHANAHIVSAAITSTQLWVLVRWQESRQAVWLFGLAFLVGLGVTHHPITVWGVPAYLVFILLTYPKIVRQVRTVLGGIASTALGMLSWLYFPLRSAETPFGPTDMVSWAGFLRHATAQGLRVNLFHFGLADQPDRWQVFLTVLRLQYGWLLLGVLLLGLVGMLVTRPKLAVLWLGFLGGHLAFTLNSVQDVMAYLLHAFVALGVPLILGVLLLVRAFRSSRSWLRLGAVSIVICTVLVEGIQRYPRISLRDWRAADAFVDSLAERFDGQGMHAALVSDWEHLTPYFYATLVEGRAFSAVDLRPVYVTGEQPWLESVYGNLSTGPVYLTNYRRDVRDAGFRLRPEGDLWRVLEPPALASVSPQYPLVDVEVDGRLELIGYDLLETSVTQGGVVPVTLYARVSSAQTGIIMPTAHLGSIEQSFSTDSRRLTPDWIPGEIITERYEVYVPFDLPEGQYPLTLDFAQVGAEPRALSLSGGEDGLLLGNIAVSSEPGARRQTRVVERSLTNIGNQVALTSAWARAGFGIRRDLWQNPLSVRAGQVLHLRLSWQVLARPTTSYTVFVHLIDATGRPWFGYDYTPLGGAYPSYLWFPKWLEGQRVEDPYRLVLQADLPAGAYWAEVGIYEMGSIRRVPQLSADGTMTGDRLILGPLVVTP